MRINFRQGLISFQQSNATAVYLQPSETYGYISHIIAPTITIATFAHGGSDYLQFFDNTVDRAWGPVVNGVTNYLYWDIDLLTAVVSHGLSTLVPITALAEPVDPLNDQHWYDLNTNTTKVWSTSKNRWQVKIRLFAGSVTLGSISQLVMQSQGSQVGVADASNPGFIMRDTQLMPLRKSTGEFLTAEDAVHVQSTVGTSGILVQPASRVISVRAGEPIPRMSMVYFSADDTVRLASSDPALSPAHIPVGIVVDAITSGDVGTLALNGEITYDQWDWSGHAGASLYIDAFGKLTITRPAGVLAYRCGFVKNQSTVILGVDAETFPQVYQATGSTIIISGAAPVTVSDSTNGIGERTVTIGVPLSTPVQTGLMSATQALQLVTHETRITTSETDITGLKLTKSDRAHLNAFSEIFTAVDRTSLVDAGSGLTLTAALLGKSNVGHKHVSTDITDFNTAVDTEVTALLKAGTNITLTRDAVANTLTISAAGGGGGGATTLRALTDVSLDIVPLVDDVLTYNGTAWVNIQPPFVGPNPYQQVFGVGLNGLFNNVSANAYTVYELTSVPNPLVKYNQYQSTFTLTAAGVYVFIISGEATPQASGPWPDGLTGYGTELVTTARVIPTKRTTHTRYSPAGGFPQNGLGKADWTDMYSVDTRGVQNVIVSLYSYAANYASSGSPVGFTLSVVIYKAV